MTFGLGLALLSFDMKAKTGLESLRTMVTGAGAGAAKAPQSAARLAAVTPGG